MSEHEDRGLGYRRDLPDVRDLNLHSEPIKALTRNSKALKKVAKTLPGAVDLRPWCSPVEDQKSLGSCTAHAGVGLLEYYQRRAHGKHIDGSRLFLYKTTRNLMGQSGDTGAELRDTMKAMVMCGVPPEKYWPYQVSKFDDEPSSFLYSLGNNYQAMKYYRLDPAGIAPADALGNIRTYLAANLPSMFGFTVYSSIYSNLGTKGEIPFPGGKVKVVGGHAVIAVGYDDARMIDGRKGALLIRNSWGTGWGDGGYGWLPYDYVLQGLANDFWALVQADFVDTDIFS